jgi:hypothetical protein
MLRFNYSEGPGSLPAPRFHALAFPVPASTWGYVTQTLLAPPLTVTLPV